MSIDQYIHKAFYKWGKIVYKFRFVFLILPFLITGGLTFGLLRKSELTRNDVAYTFTPTNGIWRYEVATINNKWPLTNGRFWPGKSFDYSSYNDIIVMPKKRDDNILEPKYLKEIEKINNHILKNVKTTVHRGNRSYDVFYNNLCLDGEGGCFENEHVIFLKNIQCKDFDVDVELDDIQLSNNISTFLTDWCETVLQSEIIVTYPMGWRGKTPVYLGESVSGVNLTDDAGHFNYANAIRLTYNLKQHRDGEVDFDLISRNWIRELEKYLVGGKEPSDILEVGLTNNESLADGMFEISAILLPYFVIAFTTLILFATICSFVLLTKDNKIVGIDWTRSKPWFALAALITSGMGILCSFGFMFFCGIEFNEIVTIMPFLIIAIGVDDMFIMTAAWHRTNPKDETNIRLGDCLSESAVSITITSITDFLAFAIGCYTVLPGVWMFCSVAAMGILFNFIYQVTFFAAVMAVAGDLENDGRHTFLVFIKTIEPEQADSLLKKIFLIGSHLHKTETTANRASAISDPTVPYPDQPHTYDPDEEETMVSKFFRYIYGPILLKPVTKIAVLIVFIIYITVAIIGTFQLEEGLNPRLLILSDHYQARYYDMMEESFFHEGLQATVVVNNPPDLSNETKMKEIEDIVAEFEGTPHTMNHNATLFFYDELKEVIKQWRKDYLFLWGKDMPEEEERMDFFNKVNTWLLWSEGRELWMNDLKWNENGTNITAFRFQIGMKDLVTANDHRETTEIFREIAGRYPKYNITTFHLYWPYTDQYQIILPTLLRNISIAAVCMILVALLLIPNIPCAILIIMAIASIDISVIGYMSFWKVNLDCVSMITIIMSIGFAVDLSAHISYAYVRSEGTSQDRAIKALETLGWPVFQGAVSTIIGTIMLSAVDAYVVQTFFKTVFLVIVFGLVHSLVFLPVALTVILPLWEKCLGVKQKAKTDEKKNNEEKVRYKMNGNDTITIDETNMIEIPLENGHGNEMKTEITEDKI